MFTHDVYTCIVRVMQKKLNTTAKFLASGAGVAGVAALMFPKLRRKHEKLYGREIQHHQKDDCKPYK